MTENEHLKWLGDLTVSLDKARQLYLDGIEQDSIFYWVKTFKPDSSSSMVVCSKKRMEKYKHEAERKGGTTEVYSAFTLKELWLKLGECNGMNIPIIPALAAASFNTTDKVEDILAMQLTAILKLKRQGIQI